MKPRFWFVFHTMWRSFDVLLADDTVNPELTDLYGLCDPDAGLIWLNTGAVDDVTVLTSTFFHESLHAIYAAPGGGSLLATLLGCTSETIESAEENVVVHTSVALADAFMRSGLLKLPPLPPR